MTGIRRIGPYLFLGLLAGPGVWPLFQSGALPRTNDALTHLYRAVQLDALVRAGVFFPRWAPDLVFGYGYPVFNFFPYLAHYLVVALHALGLDFLTAYQAAGALVLTMSAWTAYAFGRELFGEAAGLLAGAAYAYSPYLLYDLHTRGSLPESLALALLPLAFLYLRRAAHGQPRAVVGAGLAIAACLFAHNGITLQSMPFLLGYAVFEAWSSLGVGIGDFQRLSRPPFSFTLKPLLFALLPFLFGALLSAFFWLPALAESGAAQTERGTTNGGMLYTDNFFTLGELTALPRAPVDPGLLNPPVERTLPLAALVLAALAFMRVWPARSAARRPVVFFLGASGLALLSMLPVARPLWDNVPLLRLTLFPWRLLGPSALFMAVAAGALFAPLGGDDLNLGFGISPGLSGNWPLPLALALCSCFLVFVHLPFASPVFEPAPLQPGLTDVAAFEIPPDFIGTTTVGEYLPRGVKQLPAESAARRDRAARTRYTAPGATVTAAAAGPYQDTFTLTAGAPMTFTYQQFYFPGWRAALDGRPVTPRITDPDGLMAVDVPAGAHTLTFTFGDTPVRQLADALTLLGLLAVVVWLWRAPHSMAFSSPHFPLTLNPLSLTPLLLLSLALLAARPLLWDAGRTPFLQRGLTADGLRSVAHPLNQDFSGELTLLGWDAPHAAAAGEESFLVNFYWRPAHPVGVAYAFDVQLVDAQGRVWGDGNLHRPRNWRFTPGTDFWPDDQYILDPYWLTPLAGAPPGTYWAQVTAFSRYDFRVIGRALAGPLMITAPARQPCAAASLAAWGAVQLQSAAFSAPAASPGDEVSAALCWGAAQAPRADLPAQLSLTAPGGRPAVTHEFRAGQAYPAAGWPAGGVVRDALTLRLPAAIEAGVYRWTLTAAGQTVDLGALTVTVPARVFTAPALGHSLNIDLGPAALAAADAPLTVTRGAPLPVTLVWRADELLDDSYFVFVHLTAADGSVAAQSDGRPAAGARPTTGWLPGEYVVDARTIDVPADLPAGTYTLYAGLYRPGDGQRLTTPEFPEGRGALAVVTAP